MGSTGSETKISLKVMVDKKKNRVAYAQADHTFVDILFSFVTLPLDAVVREMGKQTDKKFEVLSSTLHNLYQSLADLPDFFFSTADFKSMLLNPRILSYDDSGKLKFKIEDTNAKKYFVCESWNCQQRVFSICNKAMCIFCGKQMNVELKSSNDLMNRVGFSVFNDNDEFVGEGMLASDISTFIITDDLLVMPYTSGCFIQLLSELGVSDTTHLEERTVDFGYEKILDLLRLSLSDISPLTYLTLSKKSIQVKRNDEYCISFTKEESNAKMFLEVFLQKSTGKLLFAEVEEDFVDFVFRFFSISLGTLVGTLLKGSSSFVLMDNIFKSIKSKDLGKYFKSNDMKRMLIVPHFGLRLKDFYHSSTLTYGKNEDEMFKRSGLLKRPAAGMFIVTDDLVITPSLSASTMDILNKFQVPLNDIEKHKVSIGVGEGIIILEASLRCKSALTKGLEHQLKKLNQDSC